MTQHGSRKRSSKRNTAVFITNYMTPYQASLFANSDVLVMLCRRVDSRRRWATEPKGPSTIDLSRGRLPARLWRIVAELRVSERVLVGGSSRMPEAIIACLVARVLRRPLGMWLERPSHRVGSIRVLGLKCLLGRHGRVLAVGLLAQEAYRVAGIARERVLCFPYSYGQVLRRASPVDVGASDDVRGLLIGSEWHRKGGPMLLAALDLLPPSVRSRVSLTLVGFDIDEVPTPLPTGVTDAGYVQVADLPALLTAHNLLLLPATFEGWGVVVEEAMHAGLPAIASDEVGASGILLVDGYSCLIHQAGDVSGLAELIAAYACDPELRRRLSDGAVQRSGWLASHFDKSLLLRLLSLK